MDCYCPGGLYFTQWDVRLLSGKCLPLSIFRVVRKCRLGRVVEGMTGLVCTCTGPLRGRCVEAWLRESQCTVQLPSSGKQVGLASGQ